VLSSCPLTTGCAGSKEKREQTREGEKEKQIPLWRERRRGVIVFFVFVFFSSSFFFCFCGGKILFLSWEEDRDEACNAGKDRRRDRARVCNFFFLFRLPVLPFPSFLLVLSLCKRRRWKGEGECVYVRRNEKKSYCLSCLSL